MLLMLSVLKFSQVGENFSLNLVGSYNQKGGIYGGFMDVKGESYKADTTLKLYNMCGQLGQGSPIFKTCSYKDIHTVYSHLGRVPKWDINLTCWE